MTFLRIPWWAVAFGILLVSAAFGYAATATLTVSRLLDQVEADRAGSSGWCPCSQPVVLAEQEVLDLSEANAEECRRMRERVDSSAWADEVRVREGYGVHSVGAR